MNNNINIADMYPDIYEKMMPHVNKTLEAYNNGGELSEDELNEMSAQVMKSSNVMAAYPHGHSERFVGDLAKGLILSGLGYYPYPYPYTYPYSYYSPFFLPYGRRGGYRYGRGIGRGRGRR